MLALVAALAAVLMLAGAVFCRGCVFAPLSHEKMNMTQPKLSPRDIWRTFIFGLSQDLSP